MDAPLSGHIYFDPELYDGHYFIVGPDDPINSNNVIAFCCTSQNHGRPQIHGCHSDFRLPSFHLGTGSARAISRPTWVQLDSVYYYNKADFDGKWKYAKEKLQLNLTIELLLCAARSTAISIADAKACQDQAEAIRGVR